MDDAVKLFGEVDRNKAGKIASEYPAYYNRRHIEQLEETIASMKRALERGQVPKDSILEHENRLKSEEEKLSRIKDSRPSPNAKQIDEMVKTHAELGKSIKESLFSYDEMNRGTADAHAEADRMVMPCIKVQPKMVPYLQQLNIKPVNGKISRNQASRLYKILGSNLGENTNVEKLRKVK